MTGLGAIEAELKALEERHKLIFRFGQEHKSRAEFWQQFFGDTTPNDFVRHYSFAPPGDDKGLMVISTKTPDWGTVNHFDFDFYPDGVETDAAKNRFTVVFAAGECCYVNNTELGNDRQNQHYSKHFMADTAKLCHRLNIPRMMLSAGRTMGGYAWAKYGFLCENQSEWSNLAQHIADRLEKTSHSSVPGYEKYCVRDDEGNRFPITQAEHDKIQALCTMDDTTQLWVLSDLKGSLHDPAIHGKMTLGKMLLRGQKWDGELDLTKGSEGRERFYAYLQPHVEKVREHGAR